MKSLLHQLFSRGRAEVFRLLFDGTEKSMHVRQIVRSSNLALRTIQRELSELESLDLLVSWRDGNRRCIKANQDHPLYQDISNMVSKTVGIFEILRRSLFPLSESIQYAILFGSVAARNESTQSDVDILIIGSVGLRQVTKSLVGITDQIGRTINPVTISLDEFLKRFNHNDLFIRRIVSGKKQFIIGDENEFGRLVSGRLASTI